MIKHQVAQTKRDKGATPSMTELVKQAAPQRRVQSQRGQTSKALVGAIRMASLLLLLSATVLCVAPPLCAGEVASEARASSVITSSFGQGPRTRTLILTSRRTEPIVSKLAAWLEAVYRTEVQVIYQQETAQAYHSSMYQDVDVLV